MQINIRKAAYLRQVNVSPEVDGAVIYFLSQSIEYYGVDRMDGTELFCLYDKSEESFFGQSESKSFFSFRTL